MLLGRLSAAGTGAFVRIKGNRTGGNTVKKTANVLAWPRQSPVTIKHSLNMIGSENTSRQISQSLDAQNYVFH